MRWSIPECDVVGAMASAEGKAPFDRAGVVVARRGAAGSYLQVRAYLASEEAEGPISTEEEWQALVASEQALQITPPLKAAPGAALWVLRPGFTGREAALEELRASGHLLGDARRTAGGVWLCFVREQEAAPLRDKWSTCAFEAAMSWAKGGHWERALQHAELAFTLERAMSPERIALLSLAHERCGNAVRAGAYLQMARRSRGEDFAEQVREKLEDLKRACGTGEDPPKPLARARHADDFRRGSQAAIRRALDRMRAA